MEENNIVSWTPANMLEVTLAEPDDFLKVRETLTRIGVASRKENKLFQSCHILHKQGRYFIVHFKELFMLDGKKSNLEQSDIERRNTIATLLSDWGLVEIQKTNSFCYTWIILIDICVHLLLPRKQKDLPPLSSTTLEILLKRVRWTTTYNWQIARI